MKQSLEDCCEHLIVRMSCRLALILFALWLPLERAQAAAEKSFQGLDLAQFRRVQRLGAMPEVYEMDPATHRYRLLAPVIQMPLENAYITYNPALSVFYLNNLPGEKAGSYIGPVEGDPFEMFKLEERMTAKLRADYGGDELYRVSLMIRSGDPKLRERALRIMSAALAPDVAIHTRANYTAKVRELTSGLKGDDVVQVVARLQQTEKEIEELTVVIPEAQYSPGNDALEKQGKLNESMKPSVPVPESAWGAPVDGLRAAAAFSSVTPKEGEKISVWVLVENVSNHAIKFATSDVMQSARAVVKGAEGRDVNVTAAWFTGLSPIEHHKLQPKERVTLAKKGLVFDKVQGAEHIGFGEGRAVAGPGEYRVQYESVITTGSAWSRDETDGKMHRTYPAKGEWTGSLATGETKITVGLKASAPTPAP